jgi:hypothetical protein
MGPFPKVIMVGPGAEILLGGVFRYASAIEEPMGLVPIPIMLDLCSGWTRADGFRSWRQPARSYLYGGTSYTNSRIPGLWSGKAK